ncbi:MAG: hypothetical protein H0W63_07615 [Gemmatimonadaceae bacterium]|nr:hypothetical protein [Gemmatimonadaceae bacterium]
MTSERWPSLPVTEWDDTRDDDMLLDFLESTYAAGAKLLSWDRAALERRTEGAVR